METTRHNWLYSVVPLFPDQDMWGGIYLAGYCKQCRTSFTTKLNTSQTAEVVMQKLNIPTDGCEPVE